jgi:hypothetical protein
VIILLASHAPVRALIPARLSYPVRPLLGTLIQLNVDALAAVRVGMQVALGQAAAQAVVQDVAPGRVVARVIQAVDTVPTLQADDVVHLSSSTTGVALSAFSSMALAAR